MLSRSIRQSNLGAVLHSDGTCDFTVWAPYAQRVEIEIESATPVSHPMRRDPDGYHALTLTGVTPGTRYWIVLDGEKRRPDPASRALPDGVHGPSAVVSREFAWTDHHWYGIPLESYIIYELHVGTFTSEGTFDAVIGRLDALVELGVTAVKLMPVAQFPGTRNWGYDGVQPYCVQNSYGGVDGLKRLVDACHARGLAVVLDVVYNHLGPEGNYLADFGPYFSDRYKTPWGMAFNFDGPHADHVRRYFIENALYWVTEFHIDALRLDATQAMADLSAYPVLDELVAAVHLQRDALNRRIYVIAETDRSDDRLLRPVEAGGVGMDAQWADEVHHVIHTLLTGEDQSYYKGFGKFANLVLAIRRGFVYGGQYSPVHARRHGTFHPDIPAKRFVICAQNHDHVGNRMNGERLSSLVSFEAAKLAAGLILLSPYVPLLFMGEEYAEVNPFLFFTDFGDPHLQDAVREGRKREFAAFQWQGEPPDPQAVSTFNASKLNFERRMQGRHAVMLAFYSELIRLRKTIPALRHLEKQQMEVIGFERQRVLFVRRWHEYSDVCILFNVGPEVATLTAPIPAGEWSVALCSADARWRADPDSAPRHVAAPIRADSEGRVTLSGHAFVVYVRSAT